MKIFKNRARSSKGNFEKLRRWNVVLAFLHALQGVLVVVLAKNVTFPINTSYLTLDTMSTGMDGSPSLVPAIHNVANINLAYLVAVFFFMSAIAHGLLASYLRDWYENNLTNHVNKMRWIEYSLSASTMMIGIALLSGIYDLSRMYCRDTTLDCYWNIFLGN